MVVYAAGKVGLAVQMELKSVPEAENSFTMWEGLNGHN